MKKLFVLLLSFVLFLTITKSGYAVAPTQKTFCLEALACSSNPCSGVGNKYHRARLTTRADAKLLPNKEAYIIACISGNGSSLPICTTGDSATDIKLYGQDNMSAMNHIKNPTPPPSEISWKYAFEGLFGADGVTSPNGAGKPANPVMVKSSGEIDILEWQDSVESGKNHLWQALFLVDTSEGIGAEGAGVKQNDLDFDSAGRACVKIAWDPWGRVFDSQTLEPVSGVVVSLLYKDLATGTFLPLANRSSTTKNNGKYEIVVPDGEYLIEINTPSTIKIATDPAVIHSSYDKAYYDLYTGAPIIQKGTIQHRDVAVKTPPPGTTTPLGYEYFVESSAIGMTISGTVTHPLSTVSVNTVKSTDIDLPNPPYLRKGVATATTDRDGVFSILVNQANLQNTKEYQELVYDADITKVNLAGAPVTQNPSKNFLGFLSQLLSSLLRPVYGQTMKANFRIPSMPTYLSGIAYDVSGKPLPNATVGLYLSFSKVPTYEVKTDVNGFFRVTSSNVPTMPFEIKYTTPTGQVVTTTTSQFIAQNHKANVESNTSPFEYRDSNNAVITPPVIKPTTTSGGLGSKSGTTPGRGGSANPTTNPVSGAATNPAVTQTLIVLVLLILLLGGVGVGVMLYMKNKTPQQGTF